MRGTPVWVLIPALGVACSDLPSAPSATAPPTPGTAACQFCTLPGSYALTGTVRAGGFPVAGARVGLVKLGPPTMSPGPDQLIASTLTDTSGSYALAMVENVSFSGALVAASKAGYFIDTQYVLMSGDRRQDFDLERAVHIPLGEIASQGGTAYCASAGYGGMGGSLCRRFALTAPASGTLEASVSSSAAADFDATILRPDGTIGMYGTSRGPLSIAVEVTGGLTYQIDVVPISAPSVTFSLTTALR